MSDGILQRLAANDFIPADIPHCDVPGVGVYDTHLRVLCIAARPEVLKSR
jgi:hypothetical protein